MPACKFSDYRSILRCTVWQIEIEGYLLLMLSVQIWIIIKSYLNLNKLYDTILSQLSFHQSDKSILNISYFSLLTCPTQRQNGRYWQGVQICWVGSLWILHKCGIFMRRSLSLSLSLWDKMCFFLSLGQDVFFLLTAPRQLLLLGSCRLVLSDFAKI